MTSPSARFQIRESEDTEMMDGDTTVSIYVSLLHASFGHRWWPELTFAIRWGEGTGYAHPEIYLWLSRRYSRLKPKKVEN